MPKSKTRNKRRQQKVNRKRKDDFRKMQDATRKNKEAFESFKNFALKKLTEEHNEEE